MSFSSPIIGYSRKFQINEIWRSEGGGSIAQGDHQGRVIGIHHGGGRRVCQGPMSAGAQGWVMSDENGTVSL